MRLADWSAEFLRTATDIDSNTRATYRRDLEKYVLPRFGGLALGDIRPVDIRAWMADELAAGVAPSSVRRHFRTLRRVLNAAVDNELLHRAPTQRIKPPAVPQTEMRFLTAAQVTALANELPPHFRMFVITAAYTGMRWGELVARSRLRSPSCSPTTSTHTREQPTGPTRSSSPTRPASRSSGRASSRTSGRRPRSGSVSSASASTTCATTAVALAIAMGAHPKPIQARMGHSSVQVTLDRYGHLFPELDAAIASGLDATLRSSLRVFFLRQAGGLASKEPAGQGMRADGCERVRIDTTAGWARDGDVAGAASRRLGTLVT